MSLNTTICGALADRDAGRLLAAVLQRVDAEVGELGHFLVGGPDTEDPAGVLRSAVVGIEIVIQQTVSARHCLMVTAGCRRESPFLVRGSRYISSTRR